MRTIYFNFLLIVSGFLFISGCASYPVHLIVDNPFVQRIDPVHIFVKISETKRQGKNSEDKIFDEDFYYKPGQTNKTFNFELPKGEYRFFAESDNGEAMLDVTFTIDRQLWLFLVYAGENHFQLYINQTGSVFIKK